MKRGLMQFADGRIEGLQVTPSEKDPTGVLMLSAPLTPDLAAILKCGYVYKNGADPQEGLESQALGLKLRDVDVVIGEDTFRPEMLWKFRVVRNLARYDLHFRMRVYQKNVELASLVNTYNKASFEFAVRSLQEEFKFGEDETGTGTAVDMSSEDGDEQAALPSMLSMGSTTHAKKRRQKREPTEEPTEEAVGASVQ